MLYWTSLLQTGAQPGSTSLVSQLSSWRLKVLGDLCNPGIPSTVADKLAQRLLLDAAPCEAVNRGQPSQGVRGSQQSPSSTIATSHKPVQGAGGGPTNSSSSSSGGSTTDGMCLVGGPGPTGSKPTTQVSLLTGGMPSNTTNTSTTFSSNNSASTAASTTTSASRNTSASSSRVFCLSDLHVDQGGGANLRWLQRISTHKFQQDVLLVAGGWVGVKEGRWGGGGS